VKGGSSDFTRFASNMREWGREIRKEMKKKKIAWKTLIWVILALLLLAGIIYFVSTRLTGDIVAPNGSRCMDTDGGQTYDLPGRCLQYRNSRGKISSLNEDKCLTTKTLVEYYCNSPVFGVITPTCVGQVVNCPNGCSVSEEGSFCN